MYARTLTVVLVVVVSSYCGIKEILGGEPSDAEIAVHIHHESGGNDNAVGDKNLDNWAYGPLQIRQPFVDDVNRRFGTGYRASQCRGNRPLSIKIAKLYWSIYATREKLGHEPTALDRAGILNGGPAGWRRSATAGYRRDFTAITKCQQAGRPLAEWRKFLPASKPSKAKATPVKKTTNPKKGKKRK
jgi:hypothetical protein